MSQGDGISEEIWRPVLDWEGVYEVSSRGRIRRARPSRRAYAGRLLKPFPDQNGYLMVQLGGDGRSKTTRMAKIVCDAFLGRCPRGKERNHKNGKRDDNRIENLEYVTRQQNVIHSFRVLGRKIAPPKGEQHWNVKLSDAQVAEIRRRYAAGSATQTGLAKEFTVSLSTINGIVLGHDRVV